MSALRKAAIPGGVLVALGLYMALLPWLASQGEWALLSLPAAWLLGWTALLWTLGGPWSLTLHRGGRRTTWMLAALALGCALAIAFTLWWPRGDGAVTANRIAKAWLLVLVVPLSEEFFFRGLVLADLRRRWGGPGAALLVTALFAAMHAPMGQHVPMGVLSLILCGVTLASGSVLWAVGLHTAWNAMAVIKLLPPGPERAWVLAPALLLAVTIAAWGYHTRSPS